MIRHYLIFLIVITVISLSFTACGGSGGESCVVSNCHGLNVECGFAELPICTEQYEIGDRCRALISCDDTNGDCEAVRSAAYDACKACVEACIAGSSAAEAQFGCEESCGG